MDGVASSARREADTAAKNAAANKPPVRFATIYFSNGVEPIHWWAKGGGSSMEIGPGLAPMMPYREDFTFLRGLYNQQAVASTSPHLGRMPNLLSGAAVSLDPNDIRVGTTFDQVLARQIGGQTPVPSLVLGIEPNELRLEDGVSMIYGSCISWATPTRSRRPRRFIQREPSICSSATAADASSTAAFSTQCCRRHMICSRGSAGGSPQARRISDFNPRHREANRPRRQGREAGRLAADAGKPNMPRPANELPQNVPDHMKLMLDLIVLAFQMDKTRIATCMLNNDLSQMNFRFVEGVQGALHLDLTHNGKAPAAEAMYLKTNQFHVQQFGYLMQRMKDIDEGGQSLLDNSMLLLCSNLFDGDAHSADQMPMLLAGRGGGTLKPGASSTTSIRETTTAVRVASTCR